KPDRGVIGRVDAADHDVLAERERHREKRLDEPAPDALTAYVVPNVDRMLDGVAIARPSAAPLAERSKAENVAAVGRDEDRKSLRSARGEPSAAFVERGRLRRVDRGRSGDDVVVDREDSREVGFARRTDARHGFLPFAAYAISPICLL